MSKAAYRPHIVVVDDDQEVQERIRIFFKPKPYRISFFSDAESAFEDCLKSGGGWDVLLSDFHLPNMPGAIFTEKIKKMNPELPIIFITRPKAAESAAEVIRKGAYDFLVKPIYFPQLLISIERALHLKNIKGDLVQLREQVKSSTIGFPGMIGRSPKFLAALEVARRVATSRANIFITGESGTGKEVFAKFIHNEGKRLSGPFVAINCSAIPENLLESELFGHAKGAFTGAQEKKIGLFEEAQDGTLFLDEIGDLSLNLQAKLLRVLQEKKIRRVGENQFRNINARIISATHKNLAHEIQMGAFREDLFYRLSVIPLDIPALRDRSQDILPLAESFLKRFALENGSMAKYFSKDAIKYLLQNNWRGNVRELENSVERAVVLTTEEEVNAADFAPSIIDQENLAQAGLENAVNFNFNLPFKGDLPSLEEAMQKYIEFAVRFNGGAKDQTAKKIGIDRKTLYKKLRADLTKEFVL